MESVSTGLKWGWINIGSDVIITECWEPDVCRQPWRRSTGECHTDRKCSCSVGRSPRLWQYTRLELCRCNLSTMQLNEKINHYSEVMKTSHDHARIQKIFQMEGVHIGNCLQSGGVGVQKVFFLKINYINFKQIELL